MAHQVILPRQGQSVETCRILGWKKKVGEAVREGEVLVEVETDKAVFAVESTASGTLLAILHGEGEDVAVLSPLAVIGEPEGEGKDSIAISPRARRLAEKEGLAPAKIREALPGGKGSGPGGRILESDVRAALAGGRGAGRKAAPEAAREAIPAPAIPAAGSFGPVQEIPVQGARKLIAERMTASLQSSAQYTLHTFAGAEALLAAREKLKAGPAGKKITLNDLLCFVVARLLPRHPQLNAVFSGEALRCFERVHLGMAVDTPRGLMVPVIRNADLISLQELAGEARRLQNACLEKTIRPDELAGGTFTVTNLGSLGIEDFTPVLNYPQVGILGVGAIRPRLADGPDGILIQKGISLSLTANHQVIDGAPAARFLRDLGRQLEQLDLEKGSIRA